jgi:hypothetical protein
MREKCEKCEKRAMKCEKVRNANAIRKWNQNSHRIASHYYSKKISHFCTFSHRTTIPGDQFFVWSRVLRYKAIHLFDFQTFSGDFERT